MVFRKQPTAQQQIIKALRAVQRAAPKRHPWTEIVGNDGCLYVGPAGVICVDVRTKMGEHNIPVDAYLLTLENCAYRLCVSGMYETALAQITQSSKRVSLEELAKDLGVQTKALMPLALGEVWQVDLRGKYGHAS